MSTFNIISDLLNCLYASMWLGFMRSYTNVKGSIRLAAKSNKKAVEGISTNTIFYLTSVDM